MKIKPPQELVFEAEPSGNEFVDETSFVKQEQRDALDIEKLKGLKQDRRERRKYADLVFTLISMWLTMILCFVAASGTGGLQLSDNVLITLITTSTASVIAIFLIVMKYLFRQNNL